MSFGEIVYISFLYSYIGCFLFDVVSVGSATRDVFVRVHPKVFKGNICFLPGSKVEVEEVDYFSGGGATNSAVAFSRLGLKAAALCSLGKDLNAERILKELKKERVSTALVEFSKEKKTAYSVILTGFGRDRVILAYRGATAQLNDAKKIPWRKLEEMKAKWLYVSSLHAKIGVLRKLFLFAEKTKIRVAWNPGMVELKQGLEKLKPLLKKVDVLLLNKSEALTLTHNAGVERNLEKLNRFCAIVVITEGKHGVHASDGKFTYFKKPFKVKVLDNTGAGDAFNSAFVAALIRGKKVEEALGWGMANANSVIQYLGTKNILLTQSGIKK